MTARHPLLVHDELDLLASLVPLEGVDLIEAGCGAAHLARALVARYAGSRVACLEVDERQHQKNQAAPASGLRFMQAGAQALPFADACFDGALMLKSLHHVPVPLMDRALEEIARVLRPGGWLYVSEPVYAGALNELVRLFNDEREVRAAAQQALDRALRHGRFRAVAEHRFEMPVTFRDFDEFEQRMMRPTYADHRIDAALAEDVRRGFMTHQGPDGARFTRPMHLRLLRCPG
jgi:SAM-dependent methyltransferase